MKGGQLNCMQVREQKETSLFESSFNVYLLLSELPLQYLKFEKNHLP